MKKFKETRKEAEERNSGTHMMYPDFYRHLYRKLLDLMKEKGWLNKPEGVR